MTDNEIIKALEGCCNDDHCGDCPLVYGLHDCKEKQLNLLKDALNLINRQKAEIERLNKVVKLYDVTSAEIEVRSEAVARYAEKFVTDQAR